MKNKWIWIGIAAVIIISTSAYYIGKGNGNSVAAQQKISKEEATKLAAEETNKEVKDVELQTNANGETVYEVELQDDVLDQKEDEDLYVNAETGEVLSKNSMLKNIKITDEKAKKIALEKKAGTVTDIELDDNNGIYYYDIEVVQANGKDVDIKISAENGKIIQIDRY
ncbi:PepSY domain-containing protein [Niallia sp. 03190]|uniref:PepSY domain-containing protein n=1 Tax=Niallia sp. 03190 TaxID=3458061 RepID=UPI0040448B15